MRTCRIYVDGGLSKSSPWPHVFGSARRCCALYRTVIAGDFYIVILSRYATRAVNLLSSVVIIGVVVGGGDVAAVVVVVVIIIVVCLLCFIIAVL